MCHIFHSELPTIPVITEIKKSPLWDATPEYSCTAKLGYPPGNLTFHAVRDPATFDPVVSNLTRTGDTCDSQTVVTVSAVDPALRNATRVVCQVASVHLSLLDSTQYATVHPTSVSRSQLFLLFLFYLFFSFAYRLRSLLK